MVLRAQNSDQELDILRSSREGLSVSPGVFRTMQSHNISGAGIRAVEPAPLSRAFRLNLNSSVPVEELFHAANKADNQWL